MSDFDRLGTDKAPGLPPETRAAAARYIVRRCPEPAEVLMALGLAHDPVAEAASARKALAALHTKGGSR